MMAGLVSAFSSSSSNVIRKHLVSLNIERKEASLCTHATGKASKQTLETCVTALTCVSELDICFVWLQPRGSNTVNCILQS